jgi:hypothetical protein
VGDWGTIGGSFVGKKGEQLVGQTYILSYRYFLSVIVLPNSSKTFAGEKKKEGAAAGAAPRKANSNKAMKGSFQQTAFN